jgi:hypothetical protein
MALATPTVTRIQDLHDAPTLGAGQNGYALTWNNATSAFVATALFTGGLLATGATTGATSQAQTFTIGLALPETTTDATGIVLKSNYRWLHDYYQSTGAIPTIGMNVFLGKEAGNFTMGAGNSIAQEGSRNVGIGYSSLNHNTLGHLNTGVGWEAILGNTTGWGNAGFGACALCYNQTGCENTGIGVDAMMNKTAGDKNTAVGFRSLFNNLTGGRNIALGYNAGYYETGSDALYIDAYNRVDTAGDKAGAIVYGTIASDATAQRLRFNANVGIGGAASDIYSLYVQKTSTATWVGAGVDVLISAAGKTGYGANFNVSATHSSGDMTALYGFRGGAFNASTSSGNVSYIYGAYIGTGIPDYASASGTYISNNYGLYVDVNVKTGNTIYNNYGIYVAAPTGSGDISIHNAIVTASGNVIFNESGNAYSDVRIEGDTDASLVVVDASENSVSIGSVSTSKFGVLGAAPIAQRTHVADPSGGATVDAEARSAINSILSTLELFGFHATS